MERKRVDYLRRYRHLCPARENSETQIPQEICPACGQRGEFKGFFQGMYKRMARASRLYGFPCTGAHMTFLPKMTRCCEKCTGEGPDCNGTGGFIIRSEIEMGKIRRWALARHKREIEEEDDEVETDEPHSKIVPDNPIQTRDLDVFVKETMSLKKYYEACGERNRRIGELMLLCDDLGWDIFMEMIEVWENSGRGLGVSQDSILCKASTRKNAVTLFSLYPPSENLPQRLLVYRSKIKRLFGHQVDFEFWKRFGMATSKIDDWVPVDESFTREAVERWIDLFARTT
jgi:hypothetical protein